MNTSEKINKFLAHSGICSRRKAEELILAGKVKVNGTTIYNVALRFMEDDVIEFDNKILKRNDKLRLWVFYKPKAVITSNIDSKGRKTIFDILPKSDERMISVGRLDFNTEGLLLLTNDGEFSRLLELPKTNLVREYRARIYGEVTQAIIKQLESGIEIDGIKYKPIFVEVDKEKEGKNQWVKVRLFEGKNREIRKVFEHFDIHVSRLIRVSYGPFELNRAKPGEFTEVPFYKVNKLCIELGFHTT